MNTHQPLSLLVRLVICFVVTFAAGFVAGAKVATAAANSPLEDQMLSTASTYWGTESSCPAASITVTHDLPHSEGAAARSTDDCARPEHRTIRIDAVLDVRGSSLCQLIVHEYGHLIGQEHSADSSSVMYPNPITALPIKRCLAYDPRPKKKCASKRYRRHHPNRCSGTQA